MTAWLHQDLYFIIVDSTCPTSTIWNVFIWFQDSNTKKKMETTYYYWSALRHWTHTVHALHTTWTYIRYPRGRHQIGWFHAVLSGVVNIHPHRDTCTLRAQRDRLTSGRLSHVQPTQSKSHWLCSHENESRSERCFGSWSKTWLGSWFELRSFTCIANAFPITIRICALQGNILFLLWWTHAWLQHGFSAHFQNAHARIMFRKSFAFTCPRIRLSTRITIQNALFSRFKTRFKSLIWNSFAFTRAQIRFRNVFRNAIRSHVNRPNDTLLPTSVILHEYVSLLPVVDTMETVVGVGEERGHDVDDALRHPDHRLGVQTIAHLAPRRGGRLRGRGGLGGDQVTGGAALRPHAACWTNTACWGRGGGHWRWGACIPVGGGAKKNFLKLFIEKYLTCRSGISFVN